MSESQNWKQKFEEVSATLYKKEQLLKEYEKIIHQSDKLIKEVMDKLALELKIAHQIHDILLPVDLPIIPHCEFSFKFSAAETIQSQGKDFYEVFSHPKTKSFSMIMSSCASYSLSTLLLSSRLKMMSQGDRLSHLKPNEFIALLVKEINSDIFNGSEHKMKLPTDLQDKVTLFYALINQKTYKMSYCLVGDIIVLVQCFKTGKIEIIKPCTHSLNSKEAHKLQSYELFLNGRDRVVVCSPGILSCASSKGDTYSLERLKTILKNELSSSVHHVRNQIFYELDTFSKGCMSKRDQSILVMEVKESILKLAHSE